MPRRAVRRRLSLAATIGFTAIVATLAPLTATAARPGDPPPAAAPARPSAVRGNETVDTFGYRDAIRESVWVDTGRSADGRPGGHVRVAADIIRPRELDRTGRVPVILDASPYYLCCGRGNQLQTKAYDATGRPVRFPLFYDNYFVPRGYAVVLVDLAGTNRSQGCVDVGGPEDVASATAVINWLNGRARGYAGPTGSRAVDAYWSNGSVGMIGKSWDGTIAEAVAATGIAGLKTVVPIGAISDWSDYFDANGAPLDRENPAALAAAVQRGDTAGACAGVTNALNGDPPFGARDYAADAGRVTASVFLVHGLTDYNVLPMNFGRWWAALPAAVPKMIWLSQAGHADPFDVRRAAWVRELHRWFDHYLLGIDNGVQHDPQASVEREPDRWVDYPSWPVPGATPTVWHLRPGVIAGTGGFGQKVARGIASFTDNPGSGDTDWVADPSGIADDRILYRTGRLSAPLTVSGTAAVTLRVTSNAPAARLSAVLVDYGVTTVRDDTTGDGGVRTLRTQSCWGDGSADDSACYFDTAADTTTVKADVFDRGWADLGQLVAANGHRGVVPGRAYTVTFALNTTDHEVPAGHTLALVIGGTDAGYVEPPADRPTLTVDLAGSSVLLPLGD